jgi:hypothetical protein
MLLFFAGALALNGRFGVDVDSEEAASTGETAVPAAPSGSPATAPTAAPVVTDSVAATAMARTPTGGAPSRVASLAGTRTPAPAEPGETAAADAAPTITPAVTRPAPMGAPTQGPAEPTVRVIRTPAPRAAIHSSILQLPERNEYERAYANYWRVLAEAYRTSDPSRLPEVMRGPILEEARDAVEAARVQGRGIELRIWKTTELAALPQGEDGFYVQHRYFDSSAYVELATGKEIPRESGPVYWQQNTFFRERDGRWVVVATNKQELPQNRPGV